MTAAVTRGSKLKWNVLVFPCGTENAIEIWRSLKDAKEVKLYGAAAAGSHHGPYIFKEYTPIPYITESDWIDKLNTLIQEKKIDYIFPANDNVVDALAAVRSRLASPIIMPDNSCLQIMRSKVATLKALHEIIATPTDYSSDASPPLPVFMKPDDGYGGQGAELVTTQAQLDGKRQRPGRWLIQEVLPGSEVTVDCFTDRHGALRFAGARERARVRMGTSMHARHVDGKTSELMQTYAAAISERLKPKGLWFFQMKQDITGTWKLLETGARTAGTMGFNRVQGVNFPLLALFDAAGLDVDVQPNRMNIEQDRCLHNRYRISIQYSTVYLDLDDTLIVHSHINLDLIRFIFQCINQRKTIVLLTKSLEPNLSSYLANYRLTGLFDKIIQIDESTPKSQYITTADAIFIDDSFSNCREVARNKNVPTFHPSMIEALIDERV